MDDAFLQPSQVFEQPDTGAAMDRWYEQPYFTDPAIGKLKQSAADIFMIEVGVFLPDLSFFDLNAGMVFNIVIFTGITFFQYLINCPASIAAKRFFIEYNGLAAAVFPAVITAYFEIFFQEDFEDFPAKLIDLS